MKKIALIFAAAIGLGASSASAGALCVSGTPHEAGLALTDVKLEGVSATGCYGMVSGNTSNTRHQRHQCAGVRRRRGLGSRDQGRCSGPAYECQRNRKLLWRQLDALLECGEGWHVESVVHRLHAVEVGLHRRYSRPLEASNKYAAYYFDDFLFDSTTNTGAWDINFVNGGGQTPNLSHLSVYFRDGTAVCGVRCDQEQQSVPEPMTLALLGTGLFGAGLARRRRR
jgi:hypothetical protein